MQRGLWDFISPSRDQTRIPCRGNSVLTTRLPGKSLQFKQTKKNVYLKLNIFKTLFCASLSLWITYSFPFFLKPEVWELSWDHLHPSSASETSPTQLVLRRHASWTRILVTLLPPFKSKPLSLPLLSASGSPHPPFPVFWPSSNPPVYRGPHVTFQVLTMKSNLVKSRLFITCGLPALTSSPSHSPWPSVTRVQVLWKRQAVLTSRPLHMPLALPMLSSM